jgi:hypothetical protein
MHLCKTDRPASSLRNNNIYFRAEQSGQRIPRNNGKPFYVPTQSRHPRSHNNKVLGMPRNNRVTRLLESDRKKSRLHSLNTTQPLHLTLVSRFPSEFLDETASATTICVFVYPLLSSLCKKKKGLTKQQIHTEQKRLRYAVIQRRLLEYCA